MPPFMAAPSGTRLIISSPHESTTSSSPEPTSPAARVVACWLEPHCESTVVEATSMGRPCESQAIRAMLKVCSPTWETQPPTTWPIASAGTPLRSRAAFWTVPRRSAGCIPDNPPARRPIGLRTASTM